jgi:hypothetical protein
VIGAAVIFDDLADALDEFLPDMFDRIGHVELLDAEEIVRDIR